VVTKASTVAQNTKVPSKHIKMISSLNNKAKTKTGLSTNSLNSNSAKSNPSYKLSPITNTLTPKNNTSKEISNTTKNNSKIYPTINSP
jgi:hypothetical protein